MSANFALRLADLRKEKNLSQKEAASWLGVSQALLSHYEKGIRECGLDFLKKACDYYDVTADYLLGLTDSRHGLTSDIYSKTELPTDSELRMQTLFRALADLCEKLSASGDAEEDRLREEILLSVYRFALLSAKRGISDKDWFYFDIKDGELLASNMLNGMFADSRRSENAAENAYDREPEFLKTVIDSAESLIKEKYGKILKISD